MTRIGVIGIAGKWSSETLADRVAATSGFRCLIDMSQVEFDVSDGRIAFDGQDLLELDALIIKKVGESYSSDCLDRVEVF